MTEHFIHILKIIVIAALGIWIVRYLRHKVKVALVQIYPDDLRVELVTSVLSYIVILIFGSALLNELGIQISGLLGAAGVLGIALGFAAQTSVANIISGLFLMIEQPFELGDILLFGGTEGTLVAVNLFAITLRTHDGRLVRIPHEQILKNSMVNVTGLEARRYDFRLKIRYQDDPKRALQVIQEVIANNPRCLASIKPFISAEEISGDYYELAVGAWASQENFEWVKRNLIIEIKDAFDKNGIQFAIPHYTCK